MEFFAKLGAAISSLLLATFGSLGFLHQPRNPPPVPTTVLVANTEPNVSPSDTTRSVAHGNILTIIYGTDGTTPTAFAKDNSGHLYLNYGNGYKILDPKADPEFGSVDVNSFIALDKDGTYTKDKNHIYISLAYEFLIIDGADPATFTPLRAKNGDEVIYGKDKYHVYFYGRAIEDADPASFIKDSRYAQFDKDNRHVFSVGIQGNETEVPGATSSSFIPLNAPDNSPSVYGMDYRAVYFGTSTLQGVDLASFIVDSSCTAHDRNHTYNQCSVYDPNNPDHL